MQKSIQEIKKLLEEKLNRKVLVSIQDINAVIDARKSNDFLKVYNTKLYKNQSVEYCTLLEILQDELETCNFDYSKTFHVDDIVKFKMYNGEEKTGNYRGKIDENTSCVVVNHQNWQVLTKDLYR